MTPTPAPLNAADVTNCRWDVIVVGTGVGGATLGYALAKSGKRVLFCEKGRSHLEADGAALRGAYAETLFPRPEAPTPAHRAILSRAGRYCDEIVDRSNATARTFLPFVGSGTGGSSGLYGMAMERFLPIDFAPRRSYPDEPEAALPDLWPISYAELEPYYDAAEDLYRVRGRAERPLPGLSPSNAALFRFFEAKGLHPYRLPMACDFAPGCECCQGYLCEKSCKNDSARICLAPALTLHGARLLAQCEVLRLEASRQEITGIACRWRGENLRLQADVVVLAAGALETPCILLRSACAAWPQGVANASGMVGRNLMRHYVDLYALAARDGTPGSRHKELGLSDFQFSEGMKLGTVQSFGALPPESVLAASIVDDARHAGLRSLLRPLQPLLASTLRRILAGRTILATVAEDLPYADNRVEPMSDADSARGARIAMHYRIRPRGHARIRRFRHLMKDALRPHRYLLLKQAENNQRLAHACGTCRFGIDPHQSVLDRNNRAHGIPNLYIVDSSFFPSSAGTNPSLTIAANALRVAAHLAGAASHEHH